MTDPIREALERLLASHGDCLEADAGGCPDVDFARAALASAAEPRIDAERILLAEPHTHGTTFNTATESRECPGCWAAHFLERLGADREEAEDA